MNLQQAFKKIVSGHVYENMVDKLVGLDVLRDELLKFCDRLHTLGYVSVSTRINDAYSPVHEISGVKFIGNGGKNMEWVNPKSDDWHPAYWGLAACKSIMAEQKAFAPLVPKPIDITLSVEAETIIASRSGMTYRRRLS